MTSIMSPKQKKGKKKNEAASPTGEKGGMLAAKVRGMVSMNKVRFQEGGFDLDLTYITENVIAMGFPSHGTEGYYRNPVDKVEQFFNERHKNAFRVYNLCSERNYDKESRFAGRYKRFPFDDHNAPAPISIIPDFVEDVRQFLAEEKSNVVAVHCKAGKGRTGVLITCYLMAMCRDLREPKKALEHFASLRTSDGEGVTIPSQHRYVGYWDQMLTKYNGGPPPAPPLKIDSITVSGGSQWDLFIIISQGPERMGSEPAQIFDSRRDYPSKSVSTGNNTYSFPISRSNVVVRGDVKVTFKASHRLRSSEHLFHFWFHTAFTKPGPHTFTKPLLDKAAKDKKHNVFKQNLSVTMTISEAPEECRMRGESTMFADPTPRQVPSDTDTDEEEEEEEDVGGNITAVTPIDTQPPVVKYSPVSPLAESVDGGMPAFPAPEPIVETRVEEVEVSQEKVVEEQPMEEEEEEEEPAPVPVEVEKPREETPAEKRLRELKEQRERRQKEREADRERRERERKKAEEDRKEAAAKRETELKEKAAEREREREERRRAREAAVTPVTPDTPAVPAVVTTVEEGGEMEVREAPSPVYSPSYSPPYSPTGTESTQVVDLARNIIQRIRAIEQTCSKTHNRGYSPTSPASPSSPSQAPLPFLALSLLQRSARLEIMCIQESEFREVKNRFRGGMVG